MNRKQGQPMPGEPTRREFLQSVGAAGASLAGLGVPAGEPPDAPAAAAVHALSQFALTFGDGAIVSLKRDGDTVDTQYIAPGARLGDVVIRYRRPGGEWQALDTAAQGSVRRVTASPDGSQQTADVNGPAGSDAPELAIRFSVEEQRVRWVVGIRNAAEAPLEIGDLAILLPISRGRGARGQPSAAPPILKHSLIAGDGSFILWSRGNSVGPYLMITPDPGTRLEYWEAQGGYRVFIHSAAAGAVAAERGCRWRQPNTGLRLAPGAESTYAFTLRWADDYGHARDILVEQGFIDVQVVPGMTVPIDLAARIALRSRQPIHGVDAEHPDETRLRRLSVTGEVEIHEVRFSRLGENRLTVRFGDGRCMHLEFFCTEPLETLIDKRAAFIAAHQHRDPSLWYDGLLAEWANDSHVILGPDNYDRISGWRIYEVTCDDPGLSKPAFLASRNAERPVQQQVDALDYYIRNFVWGGLQRTTEETFSWGIYGIPDWKTNRESRDPGRAGRQHLWRIYDYPHITLMYFSMYRVAKHHAYIRTALSASEYLRRAYGTALAMFTIPWEIERWSAYETGLMNEVVIEQVIDALETEGMRDQAERLRPHWERKVRTFVNEKPDLFRSEYAFDTTGFEATHALAKYALRVADPGPPEEPREVRTGWVDYPPSNRIPLERAQEFMRAQIAANLFCRGWLETAYYLLGSDIRGSGGNGYTLTYMSQMGGWSILDYALHHAEEPWPYLRLGYASFLSAWALMNTGTPESDYGYWFPGVASDGAAAGGFEPAPYGRTWLEQQHSRGAWYYSCEIDLGFCGALRCARTVLADDPLFGRIALGGELREAGGMLEVIPKDGVRRRFHALLGAGRLHLESGVERFAPGEPITVREDLSELRFRLESANPETHAGALRITGLRVGTWKLLSGDRLIDTFDVAPGATVRLEVPVEGQAGSSLITVVRG